MKIVRRLGPSVNGLREDAQSESGRIDGRIGGRIGDLAWNGPRGSVPFARGAQFWHSTSVDAHRYHLLFPPGVGRRSRGLARGQAVGQVVGQVPRSALGQGRRRGGALSGFALSAWLVLGGCALGFDDEAGETDGMGDSADTGESGASDGGTTTGETGQTGSTGETGTDEGPETGAEEGGNPSCGPSTAVVTDVLDGDTIEIDGAERVRYILVDTPEFGPTDDCYAQEARNFNNMMVYGKTISLTYDQDCRDQYDRLLAFVSVGGENVNRTLVSEGYACVLHFPPNGDSQVVEYYALLNEAFMLGKGMWSACDEPC